MIQLTYNAKTADEFKTLSEWLKEQGFTGAQAQVRDLPPKESEWVKKSGVSRMKLTKEEKERVDSGVATREGIAAERLCGLTAVFEKLGETANLPPDGEVF